MHASFKRHAAFTFIEVIIVVIIMAILSISMAVAFQNVQLKVRFDKNVSRITELFQQARTLSLSTLMIDGTDPTYYYALNLGTSSVTLIAYAADTSVTQTLETFTYDSDMYLNDLAIGIYYFPPSGEICIGAASCASGATEAEITFADRSGTYSTQFTITTAGGYVDVETTVTP